MNDMQEVYTLQLQAYLGNPEATYWGTYEVPLAELEALPTIEQGQADDLKIRSDTEKVWLARCSMGDGMPWDNMVTVERLIGGRWIEVEWWEAR